eukprot:scaffold8772_cov116-Isochrysis_galbana.AAC.1
MSRVKTSRNTTPHTNSQRSMGSATWSQIPSHAGWGEGGGDDGRGEDMRSRYGGQHCKVAESSLCVQIQQLGVESLWRGYERPTVRPSRSRARLRPMLVWCRRVPCVKARLRCGRGQ